MCPIFSLPNILQIVGSLYNCIFTKKETNIKTIITKIQLRNTAFGGNPKSKHDENRLYMMWKLKKEEKMNWKDYMLMAFAESLRPLN